MLNRTEQKSVIKDIISSIEELKGLLGTKETEVSNIEATAGQLSQLVDLIGAGDSFDLDDFTENVFNELLTTELQPVYDEISDFKSEVEDYISELSESRAETMEEKYAELDTVLEYFDQSSQSYNSLTDVFDNMDEAVSLLKDML